MAQKIIGIKRKENFSPNHITNDALILSHTGDVLKSYGYEVEYYDEAYIENNEFDAEIIFSMVRGPEGLSKLKELENKGRIIINSPTSAINCYRESMIDLLSEAEVPIPRSVVVDVDITNVDFFETLGADKIWLKRGDIHAEHKEDVTCVSSMDELQNILLDFQKRKIARAVVQKHLVGKVVKFYSVKDSDFFHWYYSNEGPKIMFDEAKLKEYANRSAESMGLDVFGGDAVISPNGYISIIDLNDWPSFAPVRDQAAHVIGGAIHKKVEAYKEALEDGLLSAKAVNK